MTRLLTSILLAVLLSITAFSQSNDPTIQQHNAWLGEQLKQLESIKPGMTRADVLKILTTEGGVSSRVERTYVGKECAYCKVRIKFRPAGPVEHGIEGSQDVVISVSQPYLQFMIVD